MRAFLASFPRAVAETRRELAISTVLFVAGLSVGAALTWSDTAWYYALVDETMAAGRTPAASTASLREALYEGDADGLATFASFLFTHNARIGMMAFATGFAVGLPTAMLMFVNGLTLGAFVGLYAQRGLLVPVLAWLLPHGVPELFAMLLCGAAGLHVGHAILAPGRETVRRALSTAGRRATRVVGGAIVLFAVAGAFEGFFRQLVTSDALRLVVAALQALWIATWLVATDKRGAPP